MKRSSILVFVLMLMLMFSTGVALAGAFEDLIVSEYELANGHLADDGVIVNYQNGQFFNLNLKQDNNYYQDQNGNGQITEAIVPVYAYIPCYLDMTLIGNGAQFDATSYGPKNINDLSIAHATAAVNNSWGMVFDNELGGFVDDQWIIQGYGRNAEIAPADNMYIQACDYFRVTLYSNDQYKYEVYLTNPLTHSNGINSIPLIMQWCEYDFTNQTWGDWTPDIVLQADDANTQETENSVTIRDTIPACTKVEFYHRFKVPYNENVVHGEYNGMLTFKAITI